MLYRLVTYLMAEMVDQNNKDFSLLQNQRSSLNIGVVVGNLLGNLFKKAVDLIIEYEEQIQTNFQNESDAMN